MAGEPTRLTLVRPPATTPAGVAGEVTPPARGSFSEILPAADSSTRGPTPDKKLAGVTGPRPFKIASLFEKPVRDSRGEKLAHEVLHRFMEVLTKA